MNVIFFVIRRYLNLPVILFIYGDRKRIILYEFDFIGSISCLISFIGSLSCVKREEPSTFRSFALRDFQSLIFMNDSDFVRING